MNATKKANTGSLIQGWKAEYSFLLLASLLAVVYVVGQTNLDFIAFFSSAITPFEACGALAFATLVVLYHRDEKSGWFSRVYASYSVGMLLWFVAECIWALYALVWDVPQGGRPVAIPPTPSLADIFWLAGYAPLLVGLLLQAWPFREGFLSRRGVTVTLCTVLIASALAIFTIPPLFQAYTDIPTLAVGLAYPILDLLLLSAAIPVFLFYHKGTYWRPLLFIILGIMLQLVGDFLFIQTFFSGAYYVGSPEDVIFDWSYLMLALGFYRALKPAIS